MYKNIGKKIQTLAAIICWIGIVASVLYAGVMWSNNSYYRSTLGTGFVVLIVGCLGSWLCTMTLYAFGQLVDDIHAMRLSNENANMKPRYRQAVKLYESKKYDEAAKIFEELGSFENASEMVMECGYCKAMREKKAGHYSNAISLFHEVKDYKDSEEQTKECWYLIGQDCIAKGDNEKAYIAFERADDYKDAAERMIEISYLDAKTYLQEGDKKNAAEIFTCMMDYKDVRQIVEGDPELYRIINDEE